MRRNFIDERVPRTISLDRLSEGDRGVVSKKLGLSGADPQRLTERLADPVFLRAQLIKLPALCLVVLETLLEGGGLLRDASLHAVVSKRTGRSTPDIVAAQALLFESGLLLGLSHGPGTSLQQTGVPTPAAAPLYELLVGVSLPHDAPPHELRADETRRRHRDLLAIATLAAHRKPRLTQRGLPDRSSLKRLAKGLGVPLEDAERALVLSTRLGFMVTSHDGMVPSAALLLKAARGEAAGSGNDPLRCASLIAADGWTSVEALGRALSCAASDDSMFYVAFAPTPEAGTIATQLAEIPLIQLAEHAGAHWVRRLAPAPVGGDGHVTPSFEVLLGPDADLATVVRVGLCCELLHIDHVLSFRLTPQSIAIGIACGLDPNELRAALASVGPHGLPENVAFMVDDWINTSRFAQVRRGTFLFTDDATAERIATGLGDDVLSRPAQGVLELRASLASAVLEKALSKAGAVLGPSGSLDDVASQRRPERYAEAPQPNDVRPTRPLPLLPQPDKELRAAVLRAQASGDYGVKAPAPGESNTRLREFESIARDQGAPAELFELLGLLRKWQKALPNELRAWIGRMPQAKRAQAHAALELPMNVLPWLLLNDKWRLRTLKMASDVDGLNRQARAVSAGGRFRPEGDRAIALLQKPQVMIAINRVLSAHAGDLGEDDEGEVCEQCGRRHGFDENDDEVDDHEMDDHEMVVDEALHAATLGRQPLPGTMPRTAPETVLALIGSATKAELALHLEVTDGGKRRVYSVLPEALRHRGRDHVLLATDIKSSDSRVFKLEHITAACIDAP